VAGLSRRREHGGGRAGHRHRPDTAPAGRPTGRDASPMIQDVLQDRTHATRLIEKYERHGGA
jgi:hypothetical protein